MCASYASGLSYMVPGSSCLHLEMLFPGHGCHTGREVLGTQAFTASVTGLVGHVQLASFASSFLETASSRRLLVF